MLGKGFIMGERQYKFIPWDWMLETVESRSKQSCYMCDPMAKAEQQLIAGESSHFR